MGMEPRRAGGMTPKRSRSGQRPNWSVPGDSLRPSPIWTQAVAAASAPRPMAVARRLAWAPSPMAVDRLLAMEPRPMATDWTADVLAPPMETDSLAEEPAPMAMSRTSQSGASRSTMSAPAPSWTLAVLSRQSMKASSVSLVTTGEEERSEPRGAVPAAAERARAKRRRDVWVFIAVFLLRRGWRRGRAGGS